MRVDQVLKKIGAEIVKADNSAERASLFIRVSQDPTNAARWRKAIEEVLLACAEQRKSSWSVDVSKVFFVDSGAVKYLWRLIFTGDVKLGTDSFGNAVMRSLSEGVEVTSMPLVGQKRYPFDPASGKTKGGHNMKTAMRAVSLAMSKGSIQ